MSDTTFYAVIDAECPCDRCRAWMEAFGTDHVAVIDPIPDPGLDRNGDPTLFVFVDVHKLTADQVDRCCKSLAGRFGLDPEEVRLDMLGGDGFPLEAKGRTFCSDVEEGRKIVRRLRELRRAGREGHADV